jgi:hypothetical protein
MTSFGQDPALAETRRKIIALASEFADVAQYALESSLRRATEQLVADHARWFNELDDETTRALHVAIDEATHASAQQIAHELRDPDLWFSPSVVVDASIAKPSRMDLDLAQPTFVPPKSVDNPFNRVWIHLSNGADRLDGILKEFALEPNAFADWGGGHYGLQPQTVEELDPSGRLVDLWGRYLKLFDHYRRLAARAGEAAHETAREEAIRRWRSEGRQG